MSNPLALFRRYQKSLLAVFGVLIIFVFVVGGYLQKALETGGRGGGDGNDTVVRWKYGTVNEREINEMRRAHVLAARFVAAIVEETQKRNGTPKAQQIPPAQTEEDVFATFMLAKKAEQMGLVVSDAAIRDWLFRLSDEVIGASEFDKILTDVGGERIQERQMFDQLKIELLAQNMRMLAFSGVTAITPSTAWDYHRRLNRRVSTEMLPLQVASYLDQVKEEPSDKAIKELFNKHKNDFPHPESPTPGFRKRQRIAFQYFKVEFEKYLQEAMKDVTDEEIKAEYDQRISQGMFKVTEPAASPFSPGEPGEPFEAPPAPELPSDGENNGDESPATEETVPSKETPEKAPKEGRVSRDRTYFVSAPQDPKTDDPKTTDPKTDDPKTDDPKTDDPKTDDPKTDDPKTDDPKTDDPKTDDPKTDDPKTDDPKTDDPKTDDPKTDDPKTDDPKTDDPKTDDPKTDDPKTDDPKTDDPKTDDPKTDDPKTDDPKTDDPKTTDPKTTDPKTTDPKTTDPKTEKKEEKFKPLEEVREEIARSLARPKAQERMDDAIKGVRRKIDRYSQKHGKWEALRKVKDDAVKPEKPDFELMAAEHGFLLMQTRLMDGLEIAETEIGSSFRFSFAGGQIQTLQFGQIAYQPGVPHFKTDRIEGSVRDTTFVFWRTDEEEERVPELDDVDEVSKGTLRSATSTTAVLDADASPTNDIFNSCQIRITSGKGEGQSRSITDYVGSTGTATVSTWDVIPDATSAYEIKKGVRTDVIVAWKMNKALELAKKDAEAIRQKVVEGGKPLRDASKELAENVIEPIPFTWMSMGNVAMSRMSTPQISRIDRVDAPGHDFMESVFGLEVGEAGVAVNQPKSNVYVVRVMGESPSIEMQREQFIDAGLQFQEFQLSQMDRQTFFRDWYDELKEEMKVVWQREAQIYR